MKNFISTIENKVQDRSSVAWRKLCEYVELVADENAEEFSPLEHLGKDLFSEIFTLPETISKLDKVKKVWLYGSNLKRIPPEIGQMTSLEYLDIYTSYDLFWLPFEVTKCRNLRESRASTRVFYGNYKNRKKFPRLRINTIRYRADNVNCSVCGNKILDARPDQYWISLQVATDVFPLLANVCSRLCKENLPAPAENYVQAPHKGGHQIPDNDILAKHKLQQLQDGEDLLHGLDEHAGSSSQTRLLGVVRKIWDK